MSERVRGQAADAVITDDLVKPKLTPPYPPPFEKYEEMYQFALCSNAVVAQIASFAEHNKIEEIPTLRYMVGCLAQLCAIYQNQRLLDTLHTPPQPFVVSKQDVARFDASEAEKNGM